MNRLVWLISLSLFSCLAFAQTDIYVVVPDGDLVALKQAILDANERSSDTNTTIVAQGHYFISDEEVLPTIKGKISIAGGMYQGIKGGLICCFSLNQTPCCV